MVAIVEPLAYAERGSVLRKALERFLRLAVLAQQAHVEMTVVRGAFGFLVTSRRFPGARQIVQAVPVDARRTPDEQLRRALDPPGLHFLSAETRHADFRDPYRALRERLDLTQALRPCIDLPEIPVEREAVHGEHIDVRESSLAIEQPQELRIDRRDSAEHHGQAGVLGVDGLPGEPRHTAEPDPAKIGRAHV